ASRGFEGRDIVLWKRLQAEPAALEHEENRYEVLGNTIIRCKRDIEDLEADLKSDTKSRDFWDKNNLAQINKDYVLVLTFRGYVPITRQQLDEIVKKSKGRVPATTPITEEFRVAAVKFFAEEVESSNAELESVHKKLAKSQEEQSKLPVENLAEQRRIS